MRSTLIKELALLINIRQSFKIYCNATFVYEGIYIHLSCSYKIQITCETQEVSTRENEMAFQLKRNRLFGGWFYIALIMILKLQQIVNMALGFLIKK